MENLLEKATTLNNTYKMIRKATDGEKLTTARTEISEMVEHVGARISQIRSDGRAADDVAKQKVLYSEYKNLATVKEKLDDKLEAIREAFEDLTSDQADFFGLTTKGKIPTEG